MYSVNCVNIKSLNPDDIEFLWRTASKERLNKAMRFRNEADSVRCLVAGELIRRLNEGPVIYNDYGKPYFQKKETFFNISHSGDWVAIAHGPSEVGIDIEHVTVEIESVSSYCFSDEERNYINETGSTDKEICFTRLWTLKESYLKYRGTGLTDRMKDISFKVKGSDVFLESDPRVGFYSCMLDEAYSMAVCGMDEGIEINYWKGHRS